MALKIKGLEANMLKVARRIESINNLAVGFDEQGAALEQGLKDITAQVKGHGEDLNFAATVLGNSTTQSEQSGEREKQEVNSQEVGQLPASTFQPT